MGYSFSNIQVRNKDAFDIHMSDALASLLATGKDLRPIENPEEADVVTAVIWKEDSPWITVVSDLFDGDTDAQIAYAKAIAAETMATTLAICCEDSDYVFLNLIDPEKNKDIWANSGFHPDGAPRRSNFNAWKGYVPDVDAFRKVMRRRNVFAEECLDDIEPMLELPPAQSTSCAGDVPKECSARQYYYAATKTADNEPPVFKYQYASVYRAELRNRTPTNKLELFSEPRSGCAGRRAELRNRTPTIIQICRAYAQTGGCFSVSTNRKRGFSK